MRSVGRSVGSAWLEGLIADQLHWAPCALRWAKTCEQAPGDATCVGLASYGEAMRDTELQRLPPAVAGLSTGAVAKRFGVAPTTLRSWDQRYGIGPAGHESGRHRRWTRDDIAVPQHMCRLTNAGVPPSEAARTALRPPSGALTGQPEPSAPETTGRPSSLQPLATPGQARKQLRGLSRAALRLDSPAVESLLASVIEQLGLIPAWDEVIMPALHTVGRKWETSGERYIEVEHLLSWQVSTALRRVTKPYGAARHGAGAPVSPVLLACVPGEVHTLPLEALAALAALAAAVSERGVPVSMFGASVPAGALAEAVRRIGPAAIVLWAQSFGTASRPLAQHFSSLEWGVPGARTHSAVMVAGPGWAGPPLPRTLRPNRLSEAVTSLLALREP